MKKELREQVYQKYKGHCAYTGKPLGESWQIDHITPKLHYTLGIAQGDPNDINNLIPCISIINHYKRSKCLDEFRKYMAEFHIRFSKYPRNPYDPKSIKRKMYMQTISDLFDISTDKPFNGKFYFETL